MVLWSRNQQGWGSCVSYSPSQSACPPAPFSQLFRHQGEQLFHARHSWAEGVKRAISCLTAFSNTIHREREEREQGGFVCTYALPLSICIIYSTFSSSLQLWVASKRCRREGEENCTLKKRNHFPTLKKELAFLLCFLAKWRCEPPGQHWQLVPRRCMYGWVGITCRGLCVYRPWQCVGSAAKKTGE